MCRQPSLGAVWLLRERYEQCFECVPTGEAKGAKVLWFDRVAVKGLFEITRRSIRKPLFQFRVFIVTGRLSSFWAPLCL